MLALKRVVFDMSVVHSMLTLKRAVFDAYVVHSMLTLKRAVFDAYVFHSRANTHSRDSRVHLALKRVVSDRAIRALTVCVSVTRTHCIVACMPLIRRVLVQMIGFINRWLHTHS
jgi:hypothetical protein